MSNTKRRIYFIVFSVLFFVITPFVIFYALGYRFDFDQKLIVTERGGVYVYTSIPGTNIYLDNELKDTTGVFNREYLSQSIRPGRYFVKAKNEGYRDWQKYIQVEPQKVSSVYPFLVLEVFDFEKIEPFIKNVSVGTTTLAQTPNPIYDNLSELFIIPDIDLEEVVIVEEEEVEKPEVLQRTFGNSKVWYSDMESKFYVEWVARDDFLPAYFCENDECINPFVFLEVNSPVIHFDFFPGRDDVIIFAVQDGGIYMVEIDKRPTQTVVEVYKGGVVDFRLSGRDTLIIKDGEDIITTKLTL